MAAEHPVARRSAGRSTSRRSFLRRIRAGAGLSWPDPPRAVRTPSRAAKPVPRRPGSKRSPVWACSYIRANRPANTRPEIGISYGSCQNRDRESVVNFAVFAARCHVQTVIGERSFIHFSNPLCIAFLRKRSAQQIFQFSFKPIGRNSRIAQPRPPEHFAEFFDRHCPNVRWIAQPLRGVECIGFFACRRAIRYDDSSSDPAHSPHFLENCQWIQKMMEGKARADDGKCRIFVWQFRNIALLPGDVRDSLLPLQLAGLIEHRRSQIDPRGVLHYFRECANQQSGPAGNIQNRVIGACCGHFDNSSERFLIADRRRGGKRHGLPRELVQNLVSMFYFHTNLAASRSFRTRSTGKTWLCITT